MELIDFDPDIFLAQYWQKRPLLIRNPWKDWHNPVDPDELAGLACEDIVEARLITGARDALQVEHGPFAESRFEQLGTQDWTLLVQAADQHIPDIAALLAPFRFIPNWRIDDVMVSYAADRGGVGAHFDQYDVFLIQGLGQRRWRLGGPCDDSSAVLPHDDLRLLADFSPHEEWVLDPGDMLYIPPGIAHDGVALGDDCMTYSIGFRAPSRSDLIGGWMDALTTETPDDRYADPDLSRQANPGEISPAAIARLHAMVTERLADRTAFAQWFGEYCSTSKYPELDWRPEQPLTAQQVGGKLAGGGKLMRNPASRFAYISHKDGSVVLFVDGESHPCSAGCAGLARLISAQDVFQVGAEHTADADAEALIIRLLNSGSLAFCDTE